AMYRTVAILGSLALAMTAILVPGSRADAGPSAAAAAQATSLTCGKPNDRGLIVYLNIEDTSATPEAQAYRAALVVYAPDGAEVHRVELQDIPTYYPLGVGCAVFGNAPSLGSFLFDPISGTMRRLTVPDGYKDDLFPLIGWQRTYREQRWAFLTDSPST